MIRVGPKNSVLQSALLAGASIGAMLALSSAANAQSMPTAPIAPVDAEPQSATALDEVVVTAQRRSERLQDVPAAISAFGGEQLENAGVVNTRDLATVTPSLSFTLNSYAPQAAIRGIGTRGVNPGDEQVVPIYLDGVYQPFVVGALFELSNIERIEVLRGPQGTLLGRNATGGAINIITEAPKPGFSGNAAVGYGSFNERSANLYVTGGTDQVSGSLSVDYIKDDGYVHDLTNDRDFGSLDSFTARAKLQFTPDDLTTITLAATYADRYDDSSIANFALNGNSIARQGRPTLTFATGNYESSQDPGFAPRLTTDQKGLSATIVRDFDAFSITSISGYQENRLSYDADIDMTPAVAFNLKSDQYDNSFNQELFITSAGDTRFKWVAGVFYFKNSAGQDPRNLNGGLIFTNTHAEAWAAYVQGSYDFTDALTLTLGGRYSDDTKDAMARNGTNTQVLPFVEKSWDSFNPSASLDYAVDDKTKVYLRYATAFKSGVFNATGFAATPVDPEQVKSWEIGIKSDPAPWIRTNFAAFTTQYDNIQIFARSPDPNNASVILQNAASAQIKGIEGDVTLRPIPGLNVIVSASYLDATYDKFPLAQSFVARAGGGNTAVIIDASGNRLTRVPEFTGSFSVDYTIPAFTGNLTASGNLYYNGGFSWGVDDRIVQGAYTTVNGQISWSPADERYKIALWGRNLTDSDHLLTVSSSVLGDQGAYSRPRTFGVRLSTEF
ncbi:TonB-dependent receptor [soil metagenome]